MIIFFMSDRCSWVFGDIGDVDYGPIVAGDKRDREKGERECRDQAYTCGPRKCGEKSDCLRTVWFNTPDSLHSVG